MITTLLKRRITIIVTLVVYLTTALGISAQIAAKAETAESAEAQKHRVLEAKAYLLLDELVSPVQSLKEPENRIYAEVVIGRLLWNKDRDRARSLIQQAADDMTSLLNTKDGPVESSLIELRQEIVSTLTNCDPKLGLNFLRSVKVPSGSITSTTQYNDTEAELWIANILASTDSAAALQAAEEAMGNRLVGNIAYTLTQILAQDKSAGGKFAEDIAQRLSGEDLLADFLPSSIAMDILDWANQGATDSRQKAARQDLTNAVTPSLPEGPARELIDLLIKAALRGDINPDKRDSTERGNALYILKWLDSRAALTAKYAPELEPELREKLARYHQLNPSVKPAAEPEKVAAPAPTEAASVSGDQSDEQESAQDRQISQALKRGQVNRAVAIASRLPLNERVLKFSDIASSLTENGNEKRAIQVLEQAWRQVSARTTNREQITAQFGVAWSFVSLDSARTRSYMELAIDELNGLVAASQTGDGFNVSYYTAFELLIRQPSNQSRTAALHSLLESCGAYLELIAQVDFDLASELAGKVEAPEARLMVQLGLVSRLIRSAPPAPAQVVDGRLAVSR